MKPCLCWLLICTLQNDSLRVLTENSGLVELLSGYKLPMVLLNKMTLEEDTMAHIKLLLPSEMEPGKKYPMIIRLYSGPGTTRVKEAYDMGKITSLS